MINTTPIRLLTSNHVLVHPRRADQTKHVQGVPNPEGVRPAHFLFSAGPPPQGRHAHGPGERGQDFYAGQRVRVRIPGGRYLYGQVAHPARSYDKVFVVVEGAKLPPVVNDPEIIVPWPMQ